MTFASPVPLEEALRILREKKLIPTSLSSADLRELAAEARNAALFSARMTQLRPLQALSMALAEMLQGTGNVADAKLILTEVYRALGYDPEAGGFPQDAPGTVPPALRGTLRDLSSQRRMELTITTNYRMVTNAAFVKRTSEDEQRRYQFPCYELVRIASRATPRGFARRKGALVTKPGDDWLSRWTSAGGELFEKGTRMIALKGAAVWSALGAGEGGYADTLGNPFPPFAFGSGMGLREVSRSEALIIGVIDPEDQAAAMPSTLRESLKAQAKQIPKDILEAFDDLEDDGEWLRLAKAKQNKVEAARKLRNRVSTLAEMLGNGKPSRRGKTGVKQPGKKCGNSWIAAWKKCDAEVDEAATAQQIKRDENHRIQPEDWREHHSRRAALRGGKAAEAVFREVCRRRFGADVPAEISRVTGAEVSAVLAGRKPLYHESWGEELASDLAKTWRFPAGVKAEAFGPHLVVYRPSVVRRVMDSDSGFYRHGTDVAPAMRRVVEDNQMGELLGYGHRAPAAGDVRAKVLQGSEEVAGFHLSQRGAETFGRERLRDYADFLRKPLRLVLE